VGSMAVIGAGTMGTGIAYVFSAAGWETTVVEPDDAQVAQSRKVLEGAAADGVRRGRLDPDAGRSLAERVTMVANVEDLTTGLDLVVESVPERVELKHRVLAAAERTEPAILASNTSSLSIDEIAAPLDRPDAFLGLHFFNPVWSLPLVEVVRGVRTSEDTLATALEIVAGIGKQAAVVRDSPGFATSRLDLVAAIEAMRMLEEGVGRAEDIDRAVQLAYRHPVGPLRLSDIVGLDVRLDIARQLSRALGPRFEPPAILIEMVASGRLGRKTGQGFFDWAQDPG
jgi:3-hydroxybutyryl-CoA dehydrogenase